MYSQIDIIQDLSALMPLLLEADPSEDMIRKYIDKSTIFIARENGEMIGVGAVMPLEDGICELKSIAIRPKEQGKGHGSHFLAYIADACAARFHTMLVGTSDYGMGFYQKCGFTYSHTIDHFFTDYYPEPIFENGEQCRHMYYLRKKLHQS